MASAVSVNQLSALIDFLESNRELALGYFNRSKEGRSQARRLWEQCSAVLNSVSANCVQKTPDQWRLYYNEYKSKLIKKIKMEKAEMSATGGGPSRSKKLTPLQERLYDLIGRDVGEPLPGVRHNPLALSQSFNSQALVEVVQMVDDGEMDIPDFEPQHHLPEEGPSTSQEANRMPELSPTTTTHAPRQADSPAPRQADSPAPRQADSPAPRQTVPPAPRRRRRRVQRSPRIVNSSEHDSMHEASARLEAMEHISAEATKELAQATQRLAAAFETLAERLREPIIIVLQNPPEARP